MNSRPIRWLGPSALLALTAVLRAPAFARSYLSDDEEIYAVIGRAIATGARVYVDVVDHKPPAIYWVYAAAHRLAGSDAAMAVLHALLVLVVWATALSVGAIARRCSANSPNVDRIAALLYVVFTTTMMSFDSLAANAELLMMLPASLALLVVLDAPVSAARGLLAGVLLSCAGAFKYQAAVEAPVLLGLVFLPRGTPLSTRLGRVAALTAGLALPWLAIAAWFQNRGDFAEAMYWFRFNFAYIGAGSAPGEVVRRALPRIALVVGPAVLLYAAAAFGLARAWNDRTGLGRWMIAWTAFSAVAVSAGSRFFGHYFHQLTAPLAVLAAPVILGIPTARRRVVIVCLALPALAFWGIAWGHGPVMRYVVQRPEPDYAAVVRWLDERDTAGGSLCVWGNSPGLVARARRPLGCRFVSANFLVGLSPATASQTDPAVDGSPNIVPGMWERFIADLRVRRPTFIVDGSAGDVSYFGKFPPEHYAALWTILEREYEVAGIVEGMRVFRRRPGI